MLLNSMRTAAAVAVCGLGLVCGAAHAGLVGTTVGVHAYSTFQDDFGIHNVDFFNGNVLVGAGTEVSHVFSFQLTQSGFATASNVFSGTVSVDISDGSIAVFYSGQAQPASITFDFTGIAGDITGLALSNSGGLTGVNAFNTPTSSATSVSGMGFTLFGYQPDTGLGQTARLTITDPGGNNDAPEPTGLALVGAALACAAWARRRQLKR